MAATCLGGAPEKIAQQAVHEESKAAIDAAIAKAPAATIAGITVSNPEIEHFHDTAGVGMKLASPLATPAPAYEFTLKGDISLFGNPDLPATLRIWQGPLPSAAGSNTVSRVQQATLNQDLRLSSLVPELAGTAFDGIAFKDVTFFYQNCEFDQTKSVGWHVDAEWVIDASCGALYSLLRRILGVNQPTMRICGELGPSQEWTTPLTCQSIALEGWFASADAKPAPGLQLATIGVRLFGIRGMKHTPQPSTIMEYGFATFGTLHLDVPASQIPLELDYDIYEAGGVAILRAKLVTVWSNAFGVKGLSISNATFTATLSFDSPWESLALDVSASVRHKGTRIDFRGSYVPGGAFALVATLERFDIDSIRDIFDALQGTSFSMPDIDLSIESANISIASGGGLTVVLNKVQLAGHTAASAVLSVGRDGVMIRGDLEGEIGFGDVELKRAYIQLFFPSSLNRSTHGPDAIVGGQVEISKQFVFDVAVHLYQDEAKRYEWTAVAALTPKGDSWALSKLVPEVRDTPLDLTLTHVVFVAASRDDPELGNMICSGYAFRKGVQFCGTLSGGITSLDSLTRTSNAGLTLRAGWSPMGFDVELVTPAEMCITLSGGIKTNPIALQIHTQPTVRLMISAGLSVPVAGSNESLTFTVKFDAGIAGASATGSMSGWWVNPCNVGQNVKLGPDLALELEIIYAQFVSTGTPSGFGLRGGIMIGQTQAQCAMQISEDPTRNMLMAEIRALQLADLVSFLHDITGESIPSPPGDYLTFEQVRLYICPAGVTFGTIVYPRGCSFRADMILFGKRADIACSISDEGLSINGGVDNFQLGPLTVRGAAGPRATIDCAIGASSQHIFIDGVVTFLEAEVEIHVDVNTLPEPRFNLFLRLAFADHLMFKLHAELAGNVSYGSLREADFIFDAELEQHILDYIRAQLLAQFEKARHGLAEGIESAQQSLEREKCALEHGIQTAQTRLDDTFRTWEAKRKTVTKDAEEVIEKYLRELGVLKDAIAAARADYNTALQAAERDVQKANNDRAAALAAAQRDVDYARRDTVNAISSAQGAVEAAQADVDRAFVSAQRDMDNARAAVQRIQNDINAQWKTVHEYEQAPWYEFWKKGAIAGLMVSIGALEAAKAIADAALQAAKMVLTSANFLEKQAMLAAARGALEAAKAASNEAIKGANTAMRAADDASRIAVNGAVEAMDAVRKGGYYVVLQGAIYALDEYKRLNEGAYLAALAALDELVHCAEIVAYEAAKVALAAANAATGAITAAQKALDLAHSAGDLGLDVAARIVQGATQAVDVRHVRLSGSLRGLVDASGASTGKRLQACVELTLLGRDIPLDATFNPRDPVALITTTFEGVWNNLEALKL